MKQSKNQKWHSRKSPGKKGFIKTIEAILAMLLTFVFITQIIPQESVSGSTTSSLNLLHSIEEDSVFRGCVIDVNMSCMNATLRTYIPNIYNFTVNISDNPDANFDLPKQKVFAESIFISGNETNYTPRIIRIFYWK